MAHGTYVHADNATGTTTASSGAGSISVATVTGAFPTPNAAQCFVVSIDAGSANPELQIVTGVSGTTFTLAGTLAHNHTAAPVALVITAESLANSRGSIDGVIDYGMDPTGTVDSTSALNNAITAASTSQQSSAVYARPGNYLFNGTIEHLGACRIFGSGKATLTNQGLTIFSGGSSLSTALMTVQNSSGGGYIAHGATVENIGFTSLAATPALTGLQLLNSQEGLFSGCSFDNLYKSVVEDFYPSTTAGCTGNLFIGTSIKTPGLPGEMAICIGPTASGVSDSHHGVWYHTNITQTQPASGVSTGVYLGVADSYVFNVIDWYTSGSGTLCQRVWADYTIAPSGQFPADVQFNGRVDLNTQSSSAPWVVTGTPGAANYPCRVSDLIWENSQPLSGLLTNVAGLIAPFNADQTAHLGFATSAPSTLTNPNTYPVLFYVSAKDATTTISMMGGTGILMNNGGTIPFLVYPGQTIAATGYTVKPLTQLVRCGVT